MTDQASNPAPPSNAPPARRKKWPWVLGIIAAIVFLVVIVLVAILVAFSVSGGASSGSSVTFEEEYISGSGAQRIAVIPVNGTIAPDVAGSGTPSAATPEGMKNALDQAAADVSVRSVILEINSPGGGITASAQIHDAIQDFKRQTEKPVVVSMADTAASGGYWISTPADVIVANETTLTGSLGVFIPLLDLTGISEEYGVGQRYIKSDEFKAMGNPWEELTDAQREVFRNIVEEQEDAFVEVIVEGRDLPEAEVRELADGRPYTGLQAFELGLVDELGNLDQAIESASELANIEDPTVVRYTSPPGLVGLLSARIQQQPSSPIEMLEEAGVPLGSAPQALYLPGLPGSSSISSN